MILGCDMALEVREFFHEKTSTWSYLLWDKGSREAAIIDPVLDFDPAAGRIGTQSARALLELAAAQGLEVRWLLETHAHADHLTAAGWLKRRLPGARTAIGRDIIAVQRHFKRVFNLGEEFTPDGSQFDRLLEDGARLPLGALEIRVLATPGHTPDGLTYVIENAAFVGDSIFMPDMGTARVDFPGGDAEQLYDSIQKLFTLPGDTGLYMCHDYAPGGRAHANRTTVAEQKAGNVHVGKGRSRGDFVRMRTARDAQLGAPQLLYPALQVNIRAGELPPAETNGVSYLKIPLTVREE